METRHVVTCFLTWDGKVLLVRRSEKVGTYRGKWAGISGYLEKSPQDQALQEIWEEAGLAPSDVRLLKAGETIEAVDEDKGIRWIVHPFLFEIAEPDKIRLDWENVEVRWITPSELSRYETVPKLKQALETVWHGEITDAPRCESKYRKNSK